MFSPEDLPVVRTDIRWNKINGDCKHLYLYIFSHWHKLQHVSCGQQNTNHHFKMRNYFLNKVGMPYSYTGEFPSSENLLDQWQSSIVVMSSPLYWLVLVTTICRLQFTRLATGVSFRYWNGQASQYKTRVSSLALCCSFLVFLAFLAVLGLLNEMKEK